MGSIRRSWRASWEARQSAREGVGALRPPCRIHRRRSLGPAAGRPPAARHPRPEAGRPAWSSSPSGYQEAGAPVHAGSLLAGSYGGLAGDYAGRGDGPVHRGAELAPPPCGRGSTGGAHRALDPGHLADYRRHLDPSALLARPLRAAPPSQATQLAPGHGEAAPVLGEWLERLGRLRRRRRRRLLVPVLPAVPQGVLLPPVAILLLPHLVL